MFAYAGGVSRECLAHSWVTNMIGSPALAVAQRMRFPERMPASAPLPPHQLRQGYLILFALGALYMSCGRLLNHIHSRMAPGH
jgi:hypothetical protein